MQDDGDASAMNSNPWFEIVGVVRELGMSPPTEKGRAAGFYVPVPPADLTPLHLMVHMRGDPMQFAPRVREIAAAVDPTEGCRFVSRCPLAIDVCSHVTPPLVEAQPHQSARCHVTAPST